MIQSASFDLSVASNDYAPHGAFRPGSPTTSGTRCQVHHVGLSLREALVVESVFRAHPELQQHLAYGGRANDDNAHILLVNADDDAALRQWEQLRSARPQTLGIMVTADRSRFHSQRTLVAPLCICNCALIVEALVSAGNDLVHTARMPVQHETPEAPRPQAHNAMPIRVLVVDDNRLARDFMSSKIDELAAQCGPVELDFAASGEEAVAAEQCHHYDLVFLDVTMPGTDGFATCQQLKALGESRVVMLTAKRSAADLYHGKEVGCDNYLTKPPSDTDLRTVLLLTALKKVR